MDTTGEKEKRTSKKNVDGRSTSSHDDKNFRTGSMEKQGGMAFGFRKPATGVIKSERLIVTEVRVRSFRIALGLIWLVIQPFFELKRKFSKFSCE
jgi:hypothetical protein